jgi:hypothetical protein
MEPAFDTTTEGHTTALTLAAVTALLDLADRSLEGGVSELVERQPFVAGYVADLARLLPDGISWSGSVGWWEIRVAQLERAAGGDLPLIRIPGLTSVRRRTVLALIALSEEDDRFLQVVRELQGGVPSEGMPVATAVAALERPGERSVQRLIDRLTCEHVVVPAPGAGQVRRVSPELWSAVRDDDVWQALTATAAPGDAAVVAHWSQDRLERLRRPLEFLASGRIDTLVVRQVPGAEGAAAVAAVLGRRLLWRTGPQLVDGPGVALAAALGAVPGTVVEPAPGERLDLPRPQGYDGPLVVLTGTAGGVGTATDTRRATVRLDRCDADERRRLWGALLPRASRARLETLAGSFVVPDGYLRGLAADAMVVAQVDGRRTPRLADVRQASRRLCDHVLETKATRIENEGLTWDDVVTSTAVRDDLEMLEHRCRLREELAIGDRGFGGPGVRALLTGPSGCGKTLAARTLAAVLERNIYRVDLAAVFDKYVGVTEKILDRLLSDAEQLDTVLLLDEGDSFLGSRTDVRSANDRYANLETNFLLQRLETYSGIVVITTNAPDRIDSAFGRRMDATIAFGKPRASARRRIWALHLPDGHGVEPAELAAIGDRHRLTGGQIRNAAQYARLLSARGQRPLDADVVLAAVEAEYRKAGAMATGRPPAQPTAAVDLDRYVRGMSRSGRRRRRRAS